MRLAASAHRAAVTIAEEPAAVSAPAPVCAGQGFARFRSQHELRAAKRYVYFVRRAHRLLVVSRSFVVAAVGSVVVVRLEVAGAAQITS